MIIKGQKIKCKKDMGGVVSVGEVVEVADISNGNLIKFEINHKKYGSGIGMMTYAEYEEFFEPYEEPVKKKREWTDWKVEEIRFQDIRGINRIRLMMYKYDGKKIKAKLLKNCPSHGIIKVNTEFVVYSNFNHEEETDVKTRVSCYPTDEFDLDKGLELAELRLMQKFNAKLIDSFIKTF